MVYIALTSICSCNTIVTLTGSMASSFPTIVADTTVEATSNSSADLLYKGYNSEELNSEKTILISGPSVPLKTSGGSIIETVSLGRSLALKFSSSKLRIEISRSAIG